MEEHTIVAASSGVPVARCDAKSRHPSENDANTALVCMAPDLLVGARNMEAALTKIQDLLADWIVPDSGISDHDVLSSILEITDHRTVLAQQRECRDAVERAESTDSFAA